MDPRTPGMRRYLYEYIFHRSVVHAQEASGKTIMVSAAKRLRADVEARLAAQGKPMDDADLGISPVLGAIEGALSEGVTDRPALFEDPSPSSAAYQAISRDFFDMAGISRTVDGRRVPAETGPAGPRLPISPYDERWSNRATVKRAGSGLRYVLDEELAQAAGGRVGQLHQVRDQGLRLYAMDEKGKAFDSGAAVTLEDVSGISELMSRMSPSEYEDVRSWVIDGARTETGSLDYRQYMSREALGRSAAVLDELASQGVAYKVRRDRKPGQIKADIEGTKISVRLTDVRAQESFVGRVYDDGVTTYYSTNYSDPSSGSQKMMTYTPTAAETVDLLRIAQGQPVARRDKEGFVGAPGTHAETAWDRSARRRVPVEVQDSYHSANDKAATFVVDDLVVDGATPVGAKVTVRRSAAVRSASARFFADAETGESFLRESVASARENLEAALDVDGLVAELEANRDAAVSGDHFPDFNGDPEVAAVQRAYWDVLRGERTTLLRPGATEEEYNEKVGVIGELQMDSVAASSTHDMLVADLAYVGPSEQKVRDHAVDAVDAMVGTYEPRTDYSPEVGEHTVRFDPVRVAKYMTSEHGSWRNSSDLIAAMRVTGLDADELAGSSFYATTVKNRMIAFNEETAKTREQVTDPFLSTVLDTVEDSITRNGAQDAQVRIDDAGVISWSANRVNRTGGLDPISGEIGQVFGRGAHGEVTTAFAGGDNYMFVPGYEARIVAQRAGEDKSVEERTLLRGYEQTMVEAVQYQVASDLMSMRTQLGDPTSLNSVYRRLYDTRHEVDFIERAAEQGLGEHWVEAVLATEARRVRYPNEIASGSTIHAAWQAENGSRAADPANDNHFDAWVLTGGRNMAIMGEESDGYFDPVMTNGSVHQGVVRYLVESASVNEDGTIVKGEETDRAPLMKLEEVQKMSFDPYDRQQMSAANLLNASAVTPPTKTAMMTFGGWTADDPLVVSKEFAARHGVRGADGEMRELVVGDKLSDLHGNKGVISLVVDRQDYQKVLGEAAAAAPGIERNRAQNLVYAHSVFVSNRDLDVVMSPFSAVSRFNGGTAREMMESPQDMVLPFKGIQPNVMGELQFIVTHKDVESGTRVYDSEALAAGRGRKASSQLAWALGSQGADAVMAEFYGPNNPATANFREMLVTMGMDMSAEGQLKIGYDDMAQGAERRLFEMPELKLTTRGSLNTKAMRADFGELIGDKGGDLELPFPLKFPTDRRTLQAGENSWKLPVLSSHLRSGQDLDDGVSVAHDYTNQYLTIHEMACRYRYAEAELERTDLKAARRTDLEKQLAETPRRAQSAFDTITSDLKSKRFSGKHNVFKESLMASRLPNSATAVWTSDPRLDIDQVAMGPAMAESLGLQDDDYALIWRDPVLRDAGVRYMRVKTDERLTGVAINPVMDKCFDGDFDGDSVAVVRLTSEAAKREAMQKLSVEANLLDLGQRDENGTYPLNMQDSLDVKVTQHVADSYAERFEDLRLRANDVQFNLEAGEIDQAAAWEARHQLVNELSDYYVDAMCGQYGDAHLRFGDAGDHVKSVVEACIDTGAKGSMSKVEAYCRHLGVDPQTMEDLGATAHTREEDKGVMMATAVKSHGTGIAGAFSQRGVKALRNQELKAVLELTYPVTQSVLQSKHDPEEARQKYETMMGPARALWKGQRLDVEPGPDGTRKWVAARDEKGREIQADVQTWKKQFHELYTSKDGLNVSVNPENVEKVAAAMSENGVMVNIDEPAQGKDRVQMGSTMDRLAYGGDFDDLLAAATNGENLFDGSQNGHFAPYSVRGAQADLAKWEAELDAGLDSPAPEAAVPVSRDVLAASDPKARARGAGKASPYAPTVRAPRPKLSQPAMPTPIEEPEYDPWG